MAHLGLPPFCCLVTGTQPVRRHPSCTAEIACLSALRRDRGAVPGSCNGCLPCCPQFVAVPPTRVNTPVFLFLCQKRFRRKRGRAPSRCATSTGKGWVSSTQSDRVSDAF